MIQHVLKKFLAFFLSLFIVATLTFFLMHAVPGDPFSTDEGMQEEIIKSLRSYYHLDQPIWKQYGQYLKGIATGNLGLSLKYHGRLASDIIADAFPISFLLGSTALCIATAVGLVLGTIAAFQRGLWIDRLCMIVSVIGISTPSFVVATLLQYLLAMKLTIFPVARWGSWMHLCLPTLALSAMPTAFIARLVRSSMVEVLQQEYIMTAKAKGLSIWQIAIHHVLRNAVIPVISYIGPLSASIMTGSFVVEKVFAIPGLGQWFVTSVMNRDYTVIMALTIFYSAVLMATVFLVDLAYLWIDPRLRFFKK